MIHRRGAASAAFEVAFAGNPPSAHRDVVRALILYVLSRTA